MRGSTQSCDDKKSLPKSSAGNPPVPDGLAQYTNFNVPPYLGPVVEAEGLVVVACAGVVEVVAGAAVVDGGAVVVDMGAVAIGEVVRDGVIDAAGEA